MLSSNGRTCKKKFITGVGLYGNSLMFKLEVRNNQERVSMGKIKAYLGIPFNPLFIRGG